jgi:cytochrome c oxidase cbb3-type subunit 3
MKPCHAVVAITALSMLSLAGCDSLVPRSLGEKLWRSRCADCHGVDGSGNTPRYMGNPWADLRDGSWKYGGDRATVENLVREGIFGKMPAVDTLTAEEMRALLDYLYELRGERS